MNIIFTFSDDTVLAIDVNNKVYKGVPVVVDGIYTDYTFTEMV